jgi:nucleotide-binding universal stress UspA family protein
MYTRILLPLDGSKAAEQVLPYARLLTDTLKLPVELLTVIDVVRLAETMGGPDKNLLNLIAENAAREKEAYLAGIARSLAPDASAYSVEQGKPEDVILEKAAAAKGTLIVMATHGRSGISRWLLGSVAEKILRATTSPLLLLRENGQQTAGRQAKLKVMIVPLDGSELAGSVLPSAVELAMRLHLEIILARAYELPTGTYPGTEAFYVPRYYRLKAVIRQEANSYLEGKVSEVKALGADKVSSVLLEGPAAEKMIELARRTPQPLIAMCTHGRSGPQRWLLGSVTEKVVRHSGRPVLVLPAKGQSHAAGESPPSFCWD